MTPGAARRRWLLALVATVLLAVLSLGLGRYAVPAQELLALLASLLGLGAPPPEPVATVVMGIRAPRVAAALLVGAALSAAGATYQALFRNPLVSPDILGVSAGAGVGAALGILLSLPLPLVQALAFAGGLLTVACVVLVARNFSARDPVLVLVLAGVVLGSLAGACISLLKFLADPYDQLPAITFWLLGSLAAVRGADLVPLTAPLLIGLVPMVLLRWRVNVMTLGDDEARALGVDAARLRMLMIVAATLMTAAAVSLAGVIGWVGLVVPHIARLMVGPDFSRLLPTAMLLGGAYLLAVDDVARLVGGVEIPLGVITALLGAPFFLWLLSRAARSWG